MSFVHGEAARCMSFDIIAFIFPFDTRVVLLCTNVSSASICSRKGLRSCLDGCCYSFLSIHVLLSASAVSRVGCSSFWFWEGCVTVLSVVVILLRHTWSKNEAEAGNYQRRRRRGDSNEEVGEGEEETTQERKDRATGRRPGAEVGSNTFTSCSLPGSSFFASSLDFDLSL